MNYLAQNPLRKDFPVLAQKINGKRLAYLDSAATTLKPLSVIEEINTYYRDETSNVHRGPYWLSENATFKFERARDLVAEFINSPDRSQVIFTSGTTESVNLVAQSYVKNFLKKDDVILLSQMEHHSNIVPWQMVAEEIGAKIQVIPINDAGEIILEEYEKLLHPKVKLISLTYVSNTLGSINPVKDFIKLAHLNQSLVFIDAAQAVAHLKIDVTDLDADFLAFSGHKMFGPTGAGVLYGKKDLLQSMPPYQGGGNMIDVVSFEKTTFNELPHKFEAGTPPIASIIALSNAIEYIHSVGFSTIHQIESDLLAYATSALKEIPGLKIYGEAKNKASVISFGIEGIHAHDLGTLLDKDAVAIRSGHHCTQPLMKFFKVAAMARASFSLYNDQADVDQLVSTLIKIKKLFT